MLDASDGQAVGRARYEGNGFGGDLLLPIQPFSQRHSLFAKLVRPRLFFDEAGWTEIPPLVLAEQLATHSGDVGAHLLSATR